MAALTRFSALLVLFALAACASEEEIRAQQEAQDRADRQECLDLGFMEGTDAFAECLLKLREIRSLDRNASGVGVGVGVGVGF